MRSKSILSLIAMAGGITLAVAMQGTAQNAPAPAAAPAAPTTVPASQPAALAMPTGKPMFSDDFESGSIDKEKWEYRSTGGVEAVVQTDKVAHGRSALKVTFPQTAASGNYAFLINNKVPDALKTRYFGRVYMFIEGETLPTAHHVFTIGSTANWPTANFIEVGVYRNVWQLVYQYNNPPAGTRGFETVVRGPAQPMGKWFCLEWEINDKPAVCNIWIDGVLTREGSFRTRLGETDLIKGMAEIGLGLRYWGRVQAPYSVYYDDYAISDARLGPIK